MPQRYAIEEVFEMAMQLERNGEQYYTAAAKHAGRGAVKKLLLEMATWERRHEEIFKEMAESIPEEHRAAYADPECEATLYLDALVAGKIFKLHDQAMQRLTGQATLAAIFDLAIGLEKESILFYLGFRDLVDAGREQIDRIIHEEMRHIRILTEQSIS